MTTFANGESGLSVRNKINASITVTDAMATDGNGNVGIGVTPSAWGASWKVLQNTGGFLGSNYAVGQFLGTNARNDGTNWRYINTAASALYVQYDSNHQWYNAPSGTAGNAIPFTQAMTLDASGNLGIGTSSPSTKLMVVGDTGLDVRNAAQTNAIAITADAGFAVFTLKGSTNAYQFFSGPVSGTVERMRIDTSGNVGIGTTSPNAASIVDAQSTTKGVRFPNMTTTQKNAIANVAGNVVFDTTLGKLCVNTGAGWQTITSV